jgi:excisionase family DNA binding protein
MNAPNPSDLVRTIFRASATDANTSADTQPSAGAAATPAIADDHATTSPVVAVDAEAVLDVEDIATLLRIGRNTVYSLVAKNQIPHRRLGKSIRFSRAAVMSWLSSWSSRVAEERQ